MITASGRLHDKVTQVRSGDMTVIVSNMVDPKLVNAMPPLPKFRDDQQLRRLLHEGLVVDLITEIGFQGLMPVKEVGIIVFVLRNRARNMIFVPVEAKAFAATIRECVHDGYAADLEPDEDIRGILFRARPLRSPLMVDVQLASPVASLALTPDLWIGFANKIERLADGLLDGSIRRRIRQRERSKSDRRR